MKNKKEIYRSLPEWSSFCPSQIRQYAIKDAHDAVKAQKAKAKKSGKPFSMKQQYQHQAEQLGGSCLSGCA